MIPQSYQRSHGMKDPILSNTFFLSLNITFGQISPILIHLKMGKPDLKKVVPESCQRTDGIKAWLETKEEREERQFRDYIF